MKTYARPVAYVRRSARSRHDPGDLSRQFQVEEVRRLAGPDADRLDIRAQDWGRSAATDKTDRRLAFLAIIEAVEQGEVSALYAYATDRLARSVEWAARLLNACRRAGVPIVTSEGRFDPDNAMTDQLFYFQAMQKEGYSRQASQKRRATVERQHAHGTRLGVAPYGAQAGEDVSAIVAAFRKAGSCYGAARAMNAAGSRTRRGALWTSKVVGDVLRREGVAHRRKPRPGAKAQADWITYQLLTCPCGKTMTSMDRRSPRVTCYLARHVSDHPRPHGIALSKLLPVLQAEAARLRVPVSAVELAADDEGQKEAVAAKRERVIDLYADGIIDKLERTRRLGKLDDELDDLDAAHAVVAVPQAIDWTQPPATVNAVLRALWERVELGPDLMPVRFVWRVPEWRAA
jgi:DNA invertase Pin-like site-specific DNA recombinase